ncbi:Na+/H+ antiporter [Ferruginibacter sp.]|uniref:Na+/H+ antiporter n=1 Tax=Ferruginibacter sp. TaxID=1940288 RepID=UPI002658148F|nr:Na+/H+ antiporter [Ferruginibacter sp.]
MESFQIVIFIMAILIGLSSIADKIKLPYPILLVGVGLVIGFVPALPDLAMNPEIVFLIFLPPLLYDAAFKTSWHEFKTAIRPISTLAITLVFFTTITVAAVTHWLVPGFGWPLAFVLGAIVSPPDAVAATGIIKGLGLNKRVITILEGESLLNDASALIAYRYAVAAVTTGVFVFWKASLEFLWVAGGGVVAGIAIGYLFILAHKKIAHNPVVETSLTLLAPYLAYLLAEKLHISGILSVVCAGLMVTWRAPEIFSYQTRMRTRAVWDTVIFLLNGIVFILIGLQLPLIINNIKGYAFMQLLGYGLLISLATIVVRIVWVFAGVYNQKLFSFKKKKIIEHAVPAETPGEIPWKNVLIVAWTGTRGVVSLATALALPLTLNNGQTFPYRNVILFLAFVVIFITLVVQGLTLPLLIKILGVEKKMTFHKEDKELELHMAHQVVDFIEKDFPVPLEPKMTNQLKKRYDVLIDKLSKEISHIDKLKRPVQNKLATPMGQLLLAQLEITKFQRELLIKFHKEGSFSDDAIKHAERELDVEEMRLNGLIDKNEK